MHEFEGHCFEMNEEDLTASSCRLTALRVSCGTAPTTKSMRGPNAGQLRSAAEMIATAATPAPGIAGCRGDPKPVGAGAILDFHHLDGPYPT